MAKCKVGNILAAEDITKLERKALLVALDDTELWPAKDLSKAVNKTRFSVGATTIKEHRRESCGCFQ
jgi:hypothetical protein